MAENYYWLPEQVERLTMTQVKFYLDDEADLTVPDDEPPPGAGPLQLATFRKRFERAAAEIKKQILESMT